MKNIQRAAGYRRVSMREQVDGHSLDAQAVNIQTYAQQQGWEVVEIYTDAGLSAKKDSHRPALERLMADAQAGRFEVIVVDKIDRFYRHLHGLLTALDQLNQAHVGFASVQERLDFTSPWGKLTLTVLGMLAEIYIQNLGQETRKGKLQRARKGLLNGSIPLGYCRGNCSACTDPNGPDYCPRYGQPDCCTEKGKIVPHPIESQIIKLAFAEYATGQSSDAQIADLINSTEVPGWNGQMVHFRSKGRPGHCPPGPLGREAVRTMLQRVLYAGKIPYYGVNENGIKRRRSHHIELFDAQHPALVDYAVFKEVNAIRVVMANTPRTGPNYPARIFPLSGIIRCGYCGSTMRGVSANGYRYYRDAGQIEHTHDCPQRLVNAKVIEKVVFQWLGKILHDPNEIARQKASVEHYEQAKARFQRVQALYLAGELEPNVYNQEKARFDEIGHTNPLQFCSNANILALEVFDGSDNGLSPSLTIETRKALRLVLEALFVRGNAIVGIEPTAAFAPQLTKNLVPEGEVFCSSGSDGIRTRDLGLDRAACLTATPRPRTGQ